MTKIGIDMMGGDFAPLEAVLGVVSFLKNNPDEFHLVLIGDQILVQQHLSNQNIDSSNYSILHAEEAILMHEHPTKALKEKPQSSIAKGFQLLASGELDAFVSAGNTGAMMVGALFTIKTIEGVIRPTIGAYIPREDGSLGLLLDVGLNSDCKPENLNQFAILGSLFAEHILGIKTPRVGLVNIGEEEGKGNLLCQSAYPLLKANQLINFVGNIEGRDILMNKADVMVCDGFTGNVVLKMAESVYDIVKKRNIEDAYFNRFNFEMYGGVPVLGVSKPVIIGHGVSKSMAFENMIKISANMLKFGLIKKIQDDILFR
jgi:glycerol-3-phosphate acyltransferase PlsX